MIGILVFSRGILERKRNAGFVGAFRVLPIMRQEE
jgi:hypothetical protein